MGVSAVASKPGVRSFPSMHRVLAAPIVLLASLSVSPSILAAQDGGVVDPAGDVVDDVAPFCTIAERQFEKEKPPILVAACQGTGIILGAFDTYSSTYNPLLRATLVDIDWNGRKRVMLFRSGEDDKPIGEDLTGTLAIAAGRSATSRLEGLTISSELFGADGMIGVAGERRVTRLGEAVVETVSERVDVAALIEADRQRAEAARAEEEGQAPDPASTSEEGL